jgi:hypothetical protein
MANLHFNELDFILEIFANSVCPFQMCPPPLFAEIIRINHLRMRATECKFTEFETLIQEARGIIARIHDFSPGKWAEFKTTSPELWMLMAGIYQASIALYCIYSLQSVSVLPQDSALRVASREYGHHLHLLLQEALLSATTKRFTIWPIVLLSIEATHSRNAEIYAFTQKQLSEMSRQLGTYVPLVAKNILERSWRTGETRWDTCFNNSYPFTSQIAVDVSHISPPR